MFEFDLIKRLDYDTINYEVYNIIFGKERI